jgi:hypothetical protein
VVVVVQPVSASAAVSTEVSMADRMSVRCRAIPRW